MPGGHAVESLYATIPIAKVGLSCSRIGKGVRHQQNHGIQIHRTFGSIKSCRFIRKMWYIITNQINRGLVI